MLRCLLLLTFFLCSSGPQILVAQEQDWGTWFDLSTSRKFRNTNLMLNGEFYTKNNNQEIDKISLGLEGNQRISPLATAGLGYLFMNIYHADYFVARNRLYTHCILKQHFGNFIWSTRQRLQLTLYRELNSDNEFYWRNLWKVEYGLPHWIVKPVASAESFFHLGKSLRHGFDEFRYLLGANIQLAAKHDFKLYGLLSAAADENRYIAGMSYEISF